MTAHPTHPELGRLFAGRFKIEREVGEGGMATIYLALQADMGRRVAIKVLQPDLLDDEELFRRFYREIKATTRIEHPNTVRVYESGHTEDGQVYLVMEYLDGRSLDDALVDEAPMPPERVARIGAQIAAALAAAHAEGIVHRDLKPENIMLLDRYEQTDWVKVFDFGLARTDEALGEGLTQVGVRIGTPLYMAPEYVRGEGIDSRADLYALGIVLFQLATGKPPFRGKPYEILDAHADTVPPRPSKLAPENVPDWLEQVILGLLEKDPDRRLQPARQVMEKLEIGRALTIGASIPGPPSRDELPTEEMQAPPARSRTGMWLGLGCAALLVVGLGGAAVLGVAGLLLLMLG